MKIAPAHRMGLLASLSVILLVVLISARPVAAQVDLVADLPSGQPVGTTIVWTVNTPQPEGFLYRLSIVRLGEAPRVVYDFGSKHVFSWTPIDQGLYLVIGTTWDLVNGGLTTVQEPFLVMSRVTTAPIVTSTDHPLVALYSAPPCPVGQRMRVHFLTSAPRRYFATNFKPCDGFRSMNFYLGGMLENHQYFVRHEVQTLAGVTQALGPFLAHTTGSAPPDLVVATPTLPTGPVSLTDSVLLVTSISLGDPRPQVPLAVDLSGRVLWYYNRDPIAKPQIFRPVAGGTFLVAFDTEKKWQGLREIDLAGHVLRETTASRVAWQLILRGQDPITAIHHEALRLPNGHTAILGSVERILEDVQGTTGPVDVLGDAVVVLDENFQVVWSWNGFDHLDVNRAAILGEHCGNVPPLDAGCPPIERVDGVTTLANDWLHSNSIAYSPTDGHLIVSMRHQDWVIKIAYGDGAGNGAVLWRLGQDGDFTLDAGGVPFPWFSHQHDASYVADDRIVLYDNGNTRCAADPLQCVSRGQVYQVDEAALTAGLAVNSDLGTYAGAVGSAQELANGGFHFHSGLKTEGTVNTGVSKVTETDPDGLSTFVVDMDSASYRSFRLVDLYRGLGGALGQP